LPVSLVDEHLGHDRVRADGDVPVSRAGKTSAVGEWKFAWMSQPRPQRPRPMHRVRYFVLSTPSVVTPARPGM
jgi:hypothetical protein